MTSKAAKRPRRMPQPASAPSPILAMCDRMMALVDRTNITDQLETALSDGRTWGAVHKCDVWRWSSHLWQEYWALETALLRCEPVTLRDALIVFFTVSAEVDSIMCELGPSVVNPEKCEPLAEADQRQLHQTAQHATFALQAVGRVLFHLFRNELPPRFADYIGARERGESTHGPDIDRLPEEATLKRWIEEPPKPANAA